ncbi:hypothetical protein REPUB_Repub13aG0181500 [Reevesia pubescens]
MGSESSPNVPILDFSRGDLKPGTDAWRLACKNVRQALEEFGCFIVEYDKFPLELHNQVFTVLEELFDLPTETKMKNRYEKPLNGYVGQIPKLPLHESLGIDNANALEGTQFFTNLMWPQGNDHFCESAQNFSELVAELERTVMRMLFESYGVGNYYDHYIKVANYLLRLFKYRKPEMNESNTGLNPHTDKTLLSIIHQGHISGLQVKLKDGQWVDVQPSPTSFVVMAGEALMNTTMLPSSNHEGEGNKILSRNVFIH